MKTITYVYERSCAFCNYCRCLDMTDLFFGIFGACLAFWCLFGTIVGAFFLIRELIRHV